jgi:hypothetical protein
MRFRRPTRTTAKPRRHSVVATLRILEKCVVHQVNRLGI